MKYLAIILTLLLTGCDFDVPLPARCVELGVAVAPDDRPSGLVIEENTGSIMEVRRACQDTLTQRKRACSIPVAEHEYVIWYVEGETLNRDHERCHSLYEQKAET